MYSRNTEGAGAKSLSFMAYSKGGMAKLVIGNIRSCICLLYTSMDNFAEISKLNVGAAIIVKGTLVATPQAKQPFEIQASEVQEMCIRDRYGNTYYAS